MGKFTDWLRGAPRLEHKAASDDFSAASDALTDALKWGLMDGSYGTIYRSQPSVYTVVEFLAWAISGVKLKVYERVSDVERVERRDTDLAELLRSPAPGLTYARWMHALVADLCVYGNALQEKVEDDRRALLPLPVWAVSAEGGSLVQASAYTVRLGQSAARVVDAEDMFHLRRYNPSDLRWGVSPLEPLRLILRGEADALRSNDDLWRKGARVGGIIEQERESPLLTFDQQKEFRQEWQEAHAGAGSTGKTAVLRPGMRWKDATWSPRESEFIEGRKLTLETVCRGLGIKPQVLGLTGTATYASQKEFHRELYVDTLGPLFRFIEAEVMDQLVPWFTTDDAIYCEFFVEEKLRLSFEEQSASLRQSVGAPWMSVDEARAKMNLPPTEDEAFAEPVKPANIVYAGTEGEAPLPEERERPLRAASVTPLPTKETP